MKKYSIELYGNGCEITIGNLTEQEVKRIKESDKEITELIYDDHTLERYYMEIDNIYHNFNIGEDFHMEVKDENGDVVFSGTSDDIITPQSFVYMEKSFDDVGDVLICCSQEKGMLFMGDIECKEFDSNELRFFIHENVGVNGIYIYGNMVGGVYYGNEELDNVGHNTFGKYFDVATNV
jgi:hypothetical protein